MPEGTTRPARPYGRWPDVPLGAACALCGAALVLSGCGQLASAQAAGQQTAQTAPAVGAGGLAFEGVPALGPSGGAIRVPASAAGVPDPLPANTANLTLGREVFAENCAVCHGADMRGNGPAAINLSPGPADLRAPHLRNATAGTLHWIVDHGLRGTGMPPWGEVLPSADLWAVVDFVQANELPAPPPDPAYPPPSKRLLQGPLAVSAGGALFDQDCAVCHGLNGEGMGPAGRALDPRPADLTAPYIAAYSNAQIAGIIRYGVSGTPMPAWGSEVGAQERADIVAYVRALQAAAGDPAHSVASVPGAIGGSDAAGGSSKAGAPGPAGGSVTPGTAPRPASASPSTTSGGPVAAAAYAAVSSRPAVPSGAAGSLCPPARARRGH